MVAPSARPDARQVPQSSIAVFPVPPWTSSPAPTTPDEATRRQDLRWRVRCGIPRCIRFEGGPMNQRELIRPRCHDPLLDRRPRRRPDPGPAPRRHPRPPRLGPAVRRPTSRFRRGRPGPARTRRLHRARPSTSRTRSRTRSPCWTTSPPRRSCWSGSASAATSPRRSSTATPTWSPRWSPPTHLQHRRPPPAARPDDDRRAAHSSMSAGDGVLPATAASPPSDPPSSSTCCEVNAHRSNQDAIQILAAMLTSALHPDPSLPPARPDTARARRQHDHLGDILHAPEPGPSASRLPSTPTIPGAGHASNQDNPAAFNAALTAFLDRHPRPGKGDRAEIASIG